MRTVPSRRLTMPYRVIFAENSIEVAFDTPDEGRPVFEAVMPFLPISFPAPPSTPKSPTNARTTTVRAVRSAKRGGQISAWLDVLQAIRDTDDGMNSSEICQRSGVAGPPGIGKSLSPVKAALEQQGIDDWESVVNKVRMGDGLRWVRGPLIDEAIAALKAYQIGRRYIRQDLLSRENASATADREASELAGDGLI